MSDLAFGSDVRQLEGPSRRALHRGAATAEAELAVTLGGDTLGVGAMDRAAERAGASYPSRPSRLSEIPPRLGPKIQRSGGVPDEELHFGSMVGNSAALRAVCAQIVRAAPTDATILILGESGTGKELVAEAVHRLSSRSAKEMIAVNCGAISANLIESELFGHERGSFTGADRIHRGHFERADGGTLFLDEICEMPKELQVKLLRVLESGTFTRVGGDRSIRVNVRIIAAAKADLELAACEGRFRRDLLFRLKVIPIVMPLLRDRVGDIALLAHHFLAALNRTGGTQKVLTPDALQLILAHDWPGNVRELKHALERAYILCEEALGPEYLPGLNKKPAPTESVRRSATTTFSIDLGVPLAHAEREFILATLDSAGGIKSRAAKLLQISTKTLYTRLREYRASGHWSGEREEAEEAIPSPA